MERGMHRGRWNKKAPVATILLLMCMFIPNLTLLQPLPAETCPHGDYLTDEGICCNKCSPGFKIVEKCHAAGQRSKCIPCPAGQYTNQMNYSPNCRSCKQCKTSKHELQVSPCQQNQNTICRCEDGYYKINIDSVISECRRCRKCGNNEKEKQKCTPEKDTECQCTENYYRVNNKCEQCKNCTAGCEHHCSSLPPQNTRAPGYGNEHLMNITGGVTAVALLLLVLGVIVTYTMTKWSTKRKLLKLSSQSSDVSSDPCEQVLIHDEEPSNNNIVKAAPPRPATEYEQPSNLPDCVPLEIKIPDLIYTVLDLVPVLQVKQLVRFLGVKDTDIEQAELDYRSCKEAHYQMLRVWAERGSRAGGILHCPLLQELLDELRKMHLGQAAEELETKYNIQ
uniref:tumor necrosis factor receptor superfamily member 1A n=1 Tax=Scatophagus argus TaxID=75038 RepID=UPI001ED84294|nr:tumor necrosis factor receptor superfamily member 1A [Scatophagus argus]XP_046255200.1 tumor necrosis factor receptor superfamily member 1A [Scatophagus argus]